MKNAPYRLAVLGIFITVLRIAIFVQVIDSGFGQLFSPLFAYSFAFIVAAGVYVSAFGLRHSAAKWPSVFGLILFGLGDLWFNESAVIYHTSGAQLVAPESNFMGILAEYIRYGMQASALVFGAFPTLAAASLGWLQSSFDKIAALNKPGIWAQIGLAFSDSLSAIGIRWGRNPQIASREKRNSPQLARQNMAVDGEIAPRRWHSLTADETAFIRQKSRAEIMATFGISDGAAGDWKRRIESGEKPWQKGGKQV